MRVFLDANILFSAAKSDGAVRRLLSVVVAAGHECWADAYVVEEARRNLMLKEDVAELALATLLKAVVVAPVGPAPTADFASVPVHEKDRPVLAAAIRFGCEALLTGDRTHFGALYGEVVEGVAIHSPRSLAALLLE